MNFSDIYQFLRALAGDRQVMGAFFYQTTDLDSVLRSVYAFGRGPRGYALDGDITTASAITPDFATGDALALTCYEAVLILVGGEDGEKAIRTREISIHDKGERKSSLMIEMKKAIYFIRNGHSMFSSRQSFTEFFAAGGVRWEDFTEFDLESVPGKITI